MNAPLAIMNNWPNGVGLFLSFLVGIGFGFALERAGFGNAKKLAYQFYFKDLTVFKVMFTAVVVAMTGIIFLGAFGVLDLSNMFINPTYIWPVIVGAIIMGAGFAIGGYCPGTSIVGLSTLKIDAIFYLIGAFFGVFVFGEAFDLIQPLFSGPYSGALGRVTIYQLIGIPAGVVGFVVVLMALGGFWGAEKIEEKYGEIITGEGGEE